MKLTIELDAAALVRWRGKLGHQEDGKWVTDDPPGEYTGRLGKVHGTNGDGRTICGKDIPGHAEPAPDQGELCAQCATQAVYVARLDGGM